MAVKRGVLWIQTDAHASQMYKGKLVNMGNNQHPGETPSDKSDPAEPAKFSN